MKKTIMTSPNIAKSFQSLFETENKWMTILLISVCALIPFVGPLALMGYTTRRFTNEREGKAPIDFEFNDFVEYITIGVWPFLVNLVASCVLTPIIFIAVTPMILIGAVPENGLLIAILVLLSCLLYFVALIIYSLFSSPMTLRASLKHSFAEGFKIGWVIDFIKKVGWQIILQGIILMLISIPLVLAGYIVVSHMQFQLYDLYLERGGEALQVHPQVLEGRPAGYIQEQAQ